MLNLRIASDLHLDSYDSDDERIALLKRIFCSGPCYDVAVIPGDLSNFKGWNCDWEHAMGLLLDTIPRDVPIVYVPGNHDFSYTEYPSQLAESLAKITRGNFTDLTQKDAYVKGVRFIGATNWYGQPLEGGVIDAIKHKWFDFRTIPYLDSVLDSWHIQDTFDLDRVRAGDIVVTHMMPSYKCVHPKYADSTANYFFVNSTPQTLNVARAHIFGHTHEMVDMQLSNARCIARPMGYKHERLVRDWVDCNVRVAT